MIHGARIRQVRQMQGLTQKELAEQVEVMTQTQLSRVESGHLQPSITAAERIAAVTGTTVDLLQRPPSVSLSKPVHYRARASATAGERVESLRWFELVVERADTLLTNLQPLPVRLEPTAEQSPQRAAQLLRRTLGLTAHEPVPYVVLAAERLGVRIFGLPVATRRHDAFSTWHGGVPRIGVLAGAPGDRLRFSVAHELGHLVLHHGMGELDDNAEREADAFAAELLLPHDAATLSIPSRPTLAHLRALKVEWGVSIRTLIRQARAVGLVDDERYQSLFRQISARGWNRVEPGHVPIEKPRAFRKMVELLYGDDVAQFAADAGWSLGLAKDVLEQHASVAELPAERPTRPGLASNIAYLRPRAV